MNGNIPSLRDLTVQQNARLSVSAAQGRLRLELAPRGREPYVTFLELSTAIDVVTQMGRIIEALLPQHPGIIKHDR